MLQWFDNNKNESSLKRFKCKFLNHFCIKLSFSCAHMKAENLKIFKLSLLYYMEAFKPKLWAFQYQLEFFWTPCINNESFWDILQSKLLSYFLAYLGQFKSKSHIQGHHWKEENQSFHLTLILMGYQALLLQKRRL